MGEERALSERFMQEWKMDTFKESFSIRIINVDGFENAGPKLPGTCKLIIKREKSNTLRRVMAGHNA